MLPQHTRHPREFEANRFVYPVLSRRSQGLSIGVNLNPDKVCNFDCIYCQVDRRSESETRFVGLDLLLDELEGMLRWASSGEIYQHPQFASVPEALRRVNDIAFSGDGEPTTYRNFDEIMEQAAAVKRRLGLDPIKMVLITNATMFHRPVVERGLATLDVNQGEIWAKLDAGTEAYFRLIDRTAIPFQRVLDNLLRAARERPLVIQSLFMQVHGVGPTTAEIDAYVARLQSIRNEGGQLSRVQVYSVARQPAESFVSALPVNELKSIASRIYQETGIEAFVY
ncbi:MAG: radical SAM protein [Planctomycetota bacterium]|nr:MAG: radical SAM protein [Planctomycetota bacterium]